MFKLFYLEACPYCRKALTYLRELMESHPEFKDLELEMVEEKKEADLANSYDYYYVPCFFYGKEKLFEGAMTKDDVFKVLQTVSQRNR